MSRLVGKRHRISHLQARQPIFRPQIDIQPGKPPGQSLFQPQRNAKRVCNHQKMIKQLTLLRAEDCVFLDASKLAEAMKEAKELGISYYS